MFTLLALLACQPPDPTDTAADRGEPTDVSAVLFSALPLARAKGGIADGLDLDGVTTVEGDGTGCGVADYTGPRGEVGIDNAFAGVLPALEAESPVPVDDGVGDAIRAGALLHVLVVEWFERGDPVVTLVRATGAPSLGADGEVEWSQTLARDEEAAEQPAEEVAMDGATLTAGPFDVELPVEVRHVDMDLGLVEAVVRLTLREDGSAEGVIGGQLDVARFVFLADAGNGHAATSVEDSVRPSADLTPGEDGQCMYLSAAVAATAVPVHLLGGP